MAGRFKEAKIDSPYDRDLKGLLAFASFSDAETTLRRLENLRQRFLAVGDKKGVEYCRQVAVTGRRRAELISRNARVSALKRREKKEVAFWFRVWLETPELFEDWLALRKKSEEFKQLLESSTVDFPSHGNGA